MSLPVLGRITWGGVVVGVIAGIIFAPQVSRLPLLNKLPTA
jgi:hypothetical protein